MSQHNLEGDHLSSYLLDTTLVSQIAASRMSRPARNARTAAGSSQPIEEHLQSVAYGSSRGGAQLADAFHQL